MADFVAFDSRAPRKGREMPGTASGDIPKIEVARDKVESDFNTFRKLQNNFRAIRDDYARNDIRGQIIKWMYEDGAFSVDAVRARLEWASKQALSTGSYTLDLTNNAAGVKTKTKVDFGIPTSNKLKMTAANTKWSIPATSDPVSDFKRVRNAARKKGIVLKYAIMDQEAFDNMVASEKFQKFAATYVANALELQMQPNLNAANNALKNAGLPTIVIWESFVRHEDKAGNHEVVSGWEKGSVSFSEDLNPGEVQYTTTADEFVETTTADKIRSGITLVKVWGVEDPISVMTKGVAYATPVLNDPHRKFILSTEEN